MLCRNLSLSFPLPSLTLPLPKELRSFLSRACSLRSAKQQQLLNSEREREQNSLHICGPCSKVVACVNFSSAIKCFLFCERRVENISLWALSAGIYPAKSRRLSRTHGTLGGTQRESVLALRTTCSLFWFFILLFVAITTDKRKKGRAWSSAPACARHDPLNACAIPHARSCRAPWPRRERARLQPDALSYG